MEMHVLSDRRLLSTAEWQRAIDAENYPLRLETTSLAGRRGFLPAKLAGRATGFEYFEDDANNTMEFLGTENFDRDWRFATGFRWIGSKTDEMKAAWMAAVAYANLTGGIVFDHEEGRVLKVEQAREVVRAISADAAALDSILEKIREKFATDK